MKFDTNNTANLPAATSRDQAGHNSGLSTDLYTPHTSDGLGYRDEPRHLTRSEFKIYSADLPILIPNF